MWEREKKKERENGMARMQGVVFMSRQEGEVQTLLEKRGRSHHHTLHSQPTNTTVLWVCACVCISYLWLARVKYITTLHRYLCVGYIDNVLNNCNNSGVKTLFGCT